MVNKELAKKAEEIGITKHFWQDEIFDEFNIVDMARTKSSCK